MTGDQSSSPNEHDHSSSSRALPIGLSRRLEHHECRDNTMTEGQEPCELEPTANIPHEDTQAADQDENENVSKTPWDSTGLSNCLHDGNMSFDLYSVPTEEEAEQRDISLQQVLLLDNKEALAHRRTLNSKDLFLEPAPPRWAPYALDIANSASLNPYHINALPILVGREFARFTWRAVSDIEIDIRVGETLEGVAQLDVANVWGINCWVGRNSQGMFGAFPSRVVGALDKNDKRREAEIFDMAIIRGGTCRIHIPADTDLAENSDAAAKSKLATSLSLRCCISYSGPHPRMETCVLRTTQYACRQHECCFEDWVVYSPLKTEELVTDAPPDEGKGKGKDTMMN